MAKQYLDLLDELRSIAQLGIQYTQNPFDLQRYERLLELSSGEYESFTGLPSEEIKQRFNRELGYITPKIGVNGVIIDEEGLILLEHRSDDHLWGIPGGWVDLGEDPETSLKREFVEEANLVIEPLHLIRFYTRLPGDFNQPHTSIHLVYFCKIVSGQIQTSHESLEIKFTDASTIQNWHKDHQSWVGDAFAFYKALTK